MAAGRQANIKKWVESEIQIERLNRTNGCLSPVDCRYTSSQSGKVKGARRRRRRQGLVIGDSVPSFDPIGLHGTARRSPRDTPDRPCGTRHGAHRTLAEYVSLHAATGRGDSSVPKSVQHLLELRHTAECTIRLLTAVSEQLPAHGCRAQGVSSQQGEVLDQGRIGLCRRQHLANPAPACLSSLVLPALCSAAQTPDRVTST